MSIVTTECPYCRKSNAVEKSSAPATNQGYKIRCSHCSKYWEDSLDTLGNFAKVTKAAPADAFAKLRETLADLGKAVEALEARNTAAAAAAQPTSFQYRREETGPTVLKFVAGMPGGAILQSDLAESAEASRRESVFITKATSEDAAHVALEKALANGRPVTSFNYRQIGDGLTKDAGSTAITERTAPAATTLRAFQPLSE